MCTIHITHSENNSATIFVEALPGRNLNNVLSECIDLAHRTGHKVKFSFNGVDTEVCGADKVLEKREWVLATMRANADKYWSSPEGVAQKEKSRKELEALQAKVDSMLQDFFIARCHQDTLVAWCGKFAEINDHIGLNFDKKALAASISSIEYIKLHEKYTKEEVRASKSKFANWIVGECVYCLEDDMPIHPVISRFAKEYALVVELNVTPIHHEFYASLFNKLQAQGFERFWAEGFYKGKTKGQALATFLRRTDDNVLCEASLSDVDSILELVKAG